MADTQHSGRGGWRGGGRPKIEGGVRHTWTVPEDIDQLAQEKGTAWLWDAVRFKVKFDNMQ